MGSKSGPEDHAQNEDSKSQGFGVLWFLLSGSFGFPLVSFGVACFFLGSFGVLPFFASVFF
jgi:hypothetical protein